MALDWVFLLDLEIGVLVRNLGKKIFVASSYTNTALTIWLQYGSGKSEITVWENTQ